MHYKESLSQFFRIKKTKSWKKEKIVYDDVIYAVPLCSAPV